MREENEVSALLTIRSILNSLPVGFPITLKSRRGTQKPPTGRQTKGDYRGEMGSQNYERYRGAMVEGSRIPVGEMQLNPIRAGRVHHTVS